MKFIVYIIIMLITIPFIYSQNLDKKHYSFSALKLDYNVSFKTNLDSLNTSFRNDEFFSFRNNISFAFYDSNFADFEINLEKLNESLFSNFEIVENTYLDYSNYLRGCGPLDDGIVNKVNSGELMLSNIIDNFVNNYIFKGKGVFFKN